MLIPSWEIECCAPPTTVGESTSWRLAFEPVSAADPESVGRVPGSVTGQLWQVEPWRPAATGSPSSPATPACALYRNSLAAYFYQSTLAASPAPMGAPPLGRHLLHGMLFGTRHGGSEYDLFPMVSATVTRIQVISWELRQDDQVATPIPGSTRLVDVRQSPKWFTRYAPGPVTSVPVDAGGRWRRRVVPPGLVFRAETGILLTIADTDAG